MSDYSFLVKSVFFTFFLMITMQRISVEAQNKNVPNAQNQVLIPF